MKSGLSEHPETLMPSRLFGNVPDAGLLQHRPPPPQSFDDGSGPPAADRGTAQARQSAAPADMRPRGQEENAQDGRVAGQFVRSWRTSACMKASRGRADRAKTQRSAPPEDPRKPPPASEGPAKASVFPRAMVIPFVIFLGAAAAFLLRSDFSTYGFPLDDGWIHRVYARSFAYGRGFEYNAGEQEAGCTSPLWAIVTAPTHWLEPLGTEYVVLAVKGIGVLLGLVTLFGVSRIGTLLTGSPRAGAVAACLFAATPRFVFSALSGMENTLLLALWTFASYAFMLQRWSIAFALLALAPVVRPEAIMLLPLGAMLLFSGAGRSVPFRRRSLLLGSSLGPSTLWCLFCLSVTRHPLPNTFYVKGHPFRLTPHLVTETIRGITQHGYAALPLFWIGLTVVLILIVWKRSESGVEPAVLLFWLLGPAAYAIAVMGTRTVFLLGYYWTRWIDPAAMALTATFCMGYAALLTLALESRAPQSRMSKMRAKRRARFFLLISTAAALALVACVPPFWRSFEDRRGHLSTDARAIHLLDIRTAEWIVGNVPPDATVGVLDAGAIKYFGNRWTIDLAGLNTADVTFHRKSPEELIAEMDWLAVFPDLVPREVLEENYVERARFEIPVEEYTISYNPVQTRKSVYEKVRAVPTGD